jgi:fatty acid desaturase
LATLEWRYADALPSFHQFDRSSALTTGSHNSPDPRLHGRIDQDILIAITDIAAYAHLSEADIEALGFELDAVRLDIEESLGENDAAYIRRTITFQRTLDVVARLIIGCSRSRAGWALGTASLAFAKSVENMEISHNVLHGQWDWMNDPEIHSSTWDWDMVGLSSQWRYSHNYRHHVFSNVLGMDDDLGFGVMRVTRDQPWKPQYLLQPIQNLFLAATFEWGIALHDVDFEGTRAATAAEKVTETRMLIGKVARQAAKDYVFFPALSRSRWRRTLAANATANLVRNLWAYTVIFCGHFPDGAEKFTADVLEHETRGEWYLRQMLGSATSEPAGCSPSRAATCVTRSSTTCSPTCRVTATHRSPCAFGRSATSTTCLTPAVRLCTNIF